MKGPNFNFNYKHNYKKFTQRTLMPKMNKNQ